MSNSMTKTSPFLRLPRELRDLIYTDVFTTAPMEWLVAHVKKAFPTRISFPGHWTKDHGHDTSAVIHAFPALCCVSRQLFLECTPFFLTRVSAFTIDTHSTKLLYDWLAQFPNNEGFKAIKEYACFEWNVFDPEITQLHYDMLTRLTNVDDLHLGFTFPELVNGMEKAEYYWKWEWEVYVDTGLTYSPHWYYTRSPDPSIRETYPPSKEGLAREKAMLQVKREEFVEAHQLRVLFDLRKLEALEFHFDATGKGIYRHNLSNALYHWFKNEWEERGKDIIVGTGFSEEF